MHKGRRREDVSVVPVPKRVPKSPEMTPVETDSRRGRRAILHPFICRNADEMSEDAKFALGY
jgi:hypothetical protein